MQPHNKGILMLLSFYLLGIYIFPDNLADIRILAFVAGGLLLALLVLRIQALLTTEKAPVEKPRNKKPSTDGIPEDPDMRHIWAAVERMSTTDFRRKPSYSGPVQYNLWGEPEPIRRESDSRPLARTSTAPPPSWDELPPPGFS